MLYTLTPQYAGGSATLVSLNVAGGPIAPGKYHLTVYSSQNAGLHDLSGNPLAGDGAAAGTSYVTTFNVTAPAPNLLSTSFGDGTTPAQTQRSEVRDIQLKFDHAVMLNSGAVTLALLNTGGSGSNNGGAPTDASAALGVPVTSDGGITWTVPILTNTSFSDKAGSLSDGIYTVTIHAAKSHRLLQQHSQRRRPIDHVPSPFRRHRREQGRQQCRLLPIQEGLRRQGGAAGVQRRFRR